MGACSRNTPLKRGVNETLRQADGQQGATRTHINPKPRLASLRTSFAPGTIAAPALGPFLSRAGDIDRQGPALKFFIMELFNRLVGFLGRGELNESEPARPAGHFIQHQVDGSDNTGLREIILQIIFHGLVGEIADE